MIARFDSPYEYARIAREMAADGSIYVSENSSGAHWDAGVSGKRALELIEKGDPKIVARVERDVDSFALEASAEMRLAYVNEVSGSRVDVPAFLGGNPRCMKRRTKRESSARHVNVYVSAVAGADITAEKSLARGCAVLGLVQAFAQVGIACDLYIVIDCEGAQSWDTGNEERLAHKHALKHGWDLTKDGNATQVIRVDSRPLDMSQSGFFIAHPSVFRNVGLAIAAPFGFHGQWSADYSCDHDVYARNIRPRLGLSDQDIFIGPIGNRDPLQDDPARFIRERVSQVLNQKEVES